MTGGILNLKKLVSHIFPLEQAKDALELASDTRNGSIKVLVVDDSEEILLSPLFVEYNLLGKSNNFC